MQIETTIEHNGTSYAAELGTIERATLGFDDHDFLSSWLHLNFSGSGQGFGGMVLGKPGDAPVSASFLVEKWIRGVLRVAGVNDWRAVEGATVYALRDRAWGPILGIASRDGRQVFFASEISDAADKQRHEFRTQHHLGRLAGDLDRAGRLARELEGRLRVLQRTVSDAITDLSESEAQS